MTAAPIPTGSDYAQFVDLVAFYLPEVPRDTVAAALHAAAADLQPKRPALRAVPDVQARPSLRQIVHHTVRYWQINRVPEVTYEAVLGEGRQPTVADCRGLAYYMAYRLTEQSLTQVGAFFDRDHSTVRSGIKATEARFTAAELNDIAERWILGNP